MDGGTIALLVLMFALAGGVLWYALRPGAAAPAAKPPGSALDPTTFDPVTGQPSRVGQGAHRGGASESTLRGTDVCMEGFHPVWQWDGSTRCSYGADDNKDHLKTIAQLKAQGLYADLQWG